MSGKAVYDWDYIRHKYVSGDDSITFEYLASQPNMPKANTLKKRSMVEFWAEQRKAFRNQVSTNVAHSSTIQEAVQQTQKLVDSAEIITQHMQLARAMKSIAAKRLKELDPSELSPKDLVAWVNAATAIERLAMGLSTSNVQVDLTAKVDVKNLDDRQLERIAAGEEIEKVLQLN